MHRILTAIAVLVLAFVLSGCLISPGFSNVVTTTETKQGDDSTPIETVTVDKTRIWPSLSFVVMGKYIGGQAKVLFKLNSDESWEISLDKASDDLDTTIQADAFIHACDVIIPVLEASLTGGASIEGLFGGAEISTDAIKALLDGLKALRETKAKAATSQ
jgi:hypothetical protein